MEKQREQRSEEDQAHIERAYAGIAEMIATVDVPLSKRTDLSLLPSELPDTPERWISNYAEGMANALGPGPKVTQQEAIAGIRAAFENKYGMTAEAYAENSVSLPEQESYGKGLKSTPEKAARHEADRRQQREHDDKAKQANRVAYVEAYCGPNQEYMMLAAVTQERTKQGLDGGHLRAFSLVKPDPTRGSDAPRVEMNDPAYERWFTSPPNILVAQYKNGELTRYADDPKLDATLEEIRGWYTSSYIKEIKNNVRWHEAAGLETETAQLGSTSKQGDSFARAILEAAKREADRDSGLARQDHSDRSR